MPETRNADVGIANGPLMPPQHLPRHVIISGTKLGGAVTYEGGAMYGDVSRLKRDTLSGPVRVPSMRSGSLLGSGR